MNWKLILTISLFGLVMAFATVYWVSSAVEPFCWVAIAGICGYLIAINAQGKYFMHGFLVSIVSSLWMTATHIILLPQYLKNHVKEAARYAKVTRDIGLGAGEIILLTEPIKGIISGVLFGFFAVLISRAFEK